MSSWYKEEVVKYHEQQRNLVPETPGPKNRKKKNSKKDKPWVLMVTRPESEWFTRERVSEWSRFKTEDQANRVRDKNARGWKGLIWEVIYDGDE